FSARRLGVSPKIGKLGCQVSASLSSNFSLDVVFVAAVSDDADSARLSLQANRKPSRDMQVICATLRVNPPCNVGAENWKLFMSQGALLLLIQRSHRAQYNSIPAVM